VPVPFDHVTWQQGLEERGAVEDLTGRELWLTGTISPRAESELVARGFQVHTRSRPYFDELATRSAQP
jgi:N-acetylmuramoyl-L-alanine amidase